MISVNAFEFDRVRVRMSTAFGADGATAFPKPINLGCGRPQDSLLPLQITASACRAMFDRPRGTIRVQTVSRARLTPDL